MLSKLFYKHKITSNSKKLECIDYIKKFRIDYNCIEKDSKYYHNRKDLHMVNRQFQFYFIKIRKNLTFYELALEKQLKEKNLILSRLSHKIIEKDFIGVYKYEPSHGTLEEIVKNSELNNYDKYSYMSRLTQLVILAHQERDPKNDFFNLNLLPQNILAVKADPYSVKLIDVFPSSFDENLKFLFVKELKDDKYIDSRLRNVFSLGRLFYFICFGEYPTGIWTQKKLENLENYIKIEHENPLNFSVIELIRNMLNHNPLDRPRLSMIWETLEDLRASTHFAFFRFRDSLRFEFKNMKNEIAQEIFNFNLTKNEIEKKKQDLDDQIDAAFKNRFTFSQKNVYRRFLNPFSRNMLNEIIMKVLKQVPNYCTNTDDVFEMIDDTVPSDYFPTTDNQIDLKDPFKMRNSKYFENDKTDARNIETEVLLYRNRNKQGKPIKVFKQDNKIYFTDTTSIERDSEIERYTLFNLFLILLENEKNMLKIKNLFSGDIDIEKFDELNNQELENYLFDNDENSKEIKKANEIDNFWTRLCKMDWKLVLVMVILQLLFFVFVALFALRKNQFGTFKREDFFISLIIH